MFYFTGKKTVSAIWKFAVVASCLLLFNLLIERGWADQNSASAAVENADKSEKVLAGALKNALKGKTPEAATATDLDGAVIKLTEAEKKALKNPVVIEVGKPEPETQGTPQKKPAGKEPSEPGARVVGRDEKREKEKTAEIVSSKKEEKPGQGQRAESAARIEPKIKAHTAKPEPPKPEVKQKKKVISQKTPPLKKRKKARSLFDLAEELEDRFPEGVRDLDFLPDETFSMEVKDVDVKDVLRAISYRYGLNFLINDAVKARVSVSFKQVKLKSAFLALMKDAQIDFSADGNIIRINTYENINALKKEAPLVTRAIVVKYTFDTDPGALFELGGGFGGSGSGGGGGGGGGRGGGGGSGSGETIGYRGNDLSLLAMAVGSMLSRRYGARVTVISRTNTILVTDVEDNVIKIEKLIRKLDVKTSQIKILARIIQASKDFTKQLGVQWGLFGKNYSPMQVGGRGSKVGIGGNRTHLGRDNVITGSKTADGQFPIGNSANELNYSLPYQTNFPGIVNTTGMGTYSLILGKISGKFLDFQLNTMETNGLGKVLASPKVITQNNQVAVINSGREVPFQTQDALGSYSINYKKAVIELRVVPHVIGDSIFLDLEIKKDDVDFSVATKVGNNPYIKTKTVNTRVVVKNGETVVIGGVISQDKIDVVSGVPYLMDIPYLGWFFRYNETRVKNSELLIFITPEIMNWDGRAEET